MPVRRVVGLNGRFSGTRKPTGTQVVAYNLYGELLRSERDFDIVLYCDTRFKDIASWAQLPGVTLKHLPFLDWSRMKAQVWEQLSFPACARADGCSLIHSPITTTPYFARGLKSVVTFHDFNFKLHPEWFSKSFTLFLEFAGILSARRADRVVVISDYVLGHARKFLAIPDTRLSRVYNGLNPLTASPAPLRSEGAAPYILCVGSLQPHKNLLRVVQAFHIARATVPDLRLKVVGRPQGNFSAIPGLEDALKTPGVELMGYLTDEELASAYANARVFCYPSLEEGFGLPVLEAMSSGTPVVTSNLSCLPEVCGGAAVLCDPYSVESIAGAVGSVLSMSEGSRLELVERGRARCRDFSWKSAAGDYARIFREVMA